MNAYVMVLNYAFPYFLTLILIEAYAARIKKKEVYRSMDTLASLSSGLTNVIKDVLGLTVVVISYKWLETRIGLFEIENIWWLYILAFIGIDFGGYWSHRLNHKVNYFWNHHIIHHSSEEFNLGCALRQSISSWFSLSFLFFFPAAVVGIPYEVIVVVQPLHLFCQYWYHTRLIGKMGFLEKILVTPSHHRVHHAINKEYLDKNLSQIFIIWDKIFGTFQEELNDVQPVYGVKRPVRTWNPLLINFQHLWLIISDAWHTISIWDKLRIWFMPTGWRPKDVINKYPVKVIQDIEAYKKYYPKISNALKYWVWVQLGFTFILMMVMFNSLTLLTYPQLLAYAFYLFLSIFCFTSLVDGSPLTLPSEILRFIFVVSVIFYQGDWFKLDNFLVNGKYLLIGYAVSSLWVVWNNSKNRFWKGKIGIEKSVSYK